MNNNIKAGDRIGNVTITSNMIAFAAEKGFRSLLGGRYSYASLKRSGHEDAGSPPEHYTAGKDFMGEELPPRWWYDELNDILVYVLSEDYCLGQSSSIFFGKAKS